MTGYASYRGKAGSRRLSFEIKSVNHRFCEVNVRLPGKFSAWDIPIQKAVRKHFERGRIDIFLKEEGSSDQSPEDLAQWKKAKQHLSRLKRELQLKSDIDFNTLLGFKQNYYRSEESFDAKAQWIIVEPLVVKLLQRLAQMRAGEGKALLQWFKKRLTVLEKVVRDLKSTVRQQTSKQKKNLQERMREMGFESLEGEKRIAAELSLLTEKLDVTEEVVRLETHLKAFREIIGQGGVIGRKLDFLMQELGREINTIAAKSQSTAISNYAVEVKTEIEKIREQAGNVE